MALILNEYYNKVLDMADPRTKDFPLIGSPLKILSIIAVYLIFCLKLGPKFMENRRPYNIKTLIILYNIIQILLNGYLAIGWLEVILKLNWKCSPIDYQSPDTASFHYSYLYFLLKLLDLVDTVFFVLRKNQRQITVLHVYHHTMMAFMIWLGMTYFAGGHGQYFCYINSIVHVIMYSYYLLCCISEKQKKNIWWKKYITQIQIVQFGAIFLMYLQLLFRNCAYPKSLALLIVAQNGIVTALFLDFYYKTYIRKKKL